MREVGKAKVVRNRRQCARRSQDFKHCTPCSRLQSKLLWRHTEYAMESTRQSFGSHARLGGPTAQ